MILDNNRKKTSRLRKMILMTMFGVLMFTSQQLMALLPNIHMTAMLIAVVTIVYRKWAALSIFVYVMITGLYSGFSTWWIPYIYIWALLWLMVMAVPKRIDLKYRIPVIAAICAIHGFLYGTLYAPAQALIFGLNFSQMIAWIVSGLYFDLLHGIGNIVMSFLIYPLVKLLFMLERINEYQ